VSFALAPPGPGTIYRGPGLNAPRTKRHYTPEKCSRRVVLMTSRSHACPVLRSGPRTDIPQGISIDDDDDASVPTRPSTTFETSDFSPMAFFQREIGIGSERRRITRATGEPSSVEWNSAKDLTRDRTRRCTGAKRRFCETRRENRMESGRDSRTLA